MAIKYISLFFIFLANLSFANYQFETIASNLDDPWSFDFLNNEQIIFTEQPGKIKIITVSSGEISEVKADYQK